MTIHARNGRLRVLCGQAAPGDTAAHYRGEVTCEPCLDRIAEHDRLIRATNELERDPAYERARLRHDRDGWS